MACAGIPRTVEYVVRPARLSMNSTTAAASVSMSVIYFSGGESLDCILPLMRCPINLLAIANPFIKRFENATEC
jgi:hypothetical protein